MGEEDRVMKFVYCMAIDEIANRLGDKKNLYVSVAVRLATTQLACGYPCMPGWLSAHPTNGGSGPRAQGYQNVCSRSAPLKAN